MDKPINQYIYRT